jgi:hypothetical protein
MGPDFQSGLGPTVIIFFPESCVTRFGQLISSRGMTHDCMPRYISQGSRIKSLSVLCPEARVMHRTFQESCPGTVAANYPLGILNGPNST